jgi:hypothetical protein
MTGDVLVFAAYGLAMQAALVAFFATYRWHPSLSSRVGAAVYAFGALGILVGGWLALAGSGWRLALGPAITAAWAVFGAAVDLWRPRPWRGPPVIWPVLVPYVVLYFFSQMFMWWPLWNLARPAWAAFLVLFVVNTALNIRGHVEAGRTPSA